MPERVDVVIVGAGHNGLVCGCYLARAGLQVLVVERRHIAGGAVVTEEDIFAGYKLDTCSSFHIVIKALPIIEELGLEQFGLEYLQMDPFAFAPFPDGTSLTFWRDLDRTCESIARISPHDAERYHEFVTVWGAFNTPVYSAFLQPPRLGAMLPGILRQQGRIAKKLSGKGMDLVRGILGSSSQLIDTYFEDERVKAALGWFAAQSGTGPDDPGSGEMLSWQILCHQTGCWRPRGGSGMLTQALVRCLEHHGGAVRVNAPVARILTANGHASGVRLVDGTVIESRHVISNAHIQTTMLDLLAPDTLDAALVHKLRTLRIADGMGMTVRCTADALPNYTALPMQEQRPNASHRGMHLISPSMTSLRRAFHESALGQMPSEPAIVGMTPTALDPSLAPEGKHIFNVWAQWHPYTIADGSSWDDVGRREADKILHIMDRYAPGFSQHITNVYLKTPVDLERIGGLRRGHLMHIDMTLDQMFMFRPLPELSNYRTPIEGLWLTGASTHPGGGVSGASGYNTAHELLRHWRRTKRNDAPRS